MCKCIHKTPQEEEAARRTASFIQFELTFNSWPSRYLQTQVTKGKLFYYSHKLLKPPCDAKSTLPWNHILPTNNFHMQKKSKNFRPIQSWKLNSFNLGNKDENVSCQQIILQSKTTHTPFTPPREQAPDTTLSERTHALSLHTLGGFQWNNYN